MIPIQIGSAELLAAIVVLAGFLLTTMKIYGGEFLKRFEKLEKKVENIQGALMRGGLKIRRAEEDDDET